MIALKWSGNINRENFDYGLVPGFQDAIFISVTDAQDLPSFLSQIRIRREDLPDYYTPYAAYGGSFLYLHNEATSNVIVVNLATKETKTLAQIMPSHYFGRQFAVGKDGVLLITHPYSFYRLGNDGTITHQCDPVNCEMPGFENPSPKDFCWKPMSAFPPSIASNESMFVLGGHPYDKVYQFSLSGKFIRTLRFPTEDEFVHQVAIDRFGQTFVSTENKLFVFSEDGEIAHYWRNDELKVGGGLPCLRSSIYIDHNDYLWMHGEGDGERIPLYALELTW